MTADSHQTDIEIYIKTTTAEPLLAWLAQCFASSIPTEISSQGQKALRFEIPHSGSMLPITIMVQPLRGFCSLNIDSDNTPWTSDLALAQAFSRDTGLTVRCSDGLWHEGADPDAWIEISPQGEKHFLWKD